MSNMEKLLEYKENVFLKEKGYTNSVNDPLYIKEIDKTIASILREYEDWLKERTDPFGTGLPPSVFGNTELKR